MVVRTLRAKEFARDVQGFTSHNDNLLAIEKLFGDGAGKATEQVPLAVDDLVEELANAAAEYCCVAKVVVCWTVFPRTAKAREY